MISISQTVLEAHLGRIRSSAAELELEAEHFAKQTQGTDAAPTDLQEIPDGLVAETITQEFHRLRDEMHATGRALEAVSIRFMAVCDIINRAEGFCIAAARKLDEAT